MVLYYATIFGIFFLIQYSSFPQHHSYTISPWGTGSGFEHRATYPTTSLRRILLSYVAHQKLRYTLWATPHPKATSHPLKIRSTKKTCLTPLVDSLSGKCAFLSGAYYFNKFISPLFNINFLIALTNILQVCVLYNAVHVYSLIF